MSKNRYINTHIWDDAYIESLDPCEKLIFIYLLTNALTNISGIYEITLKRIAYDTGYDKEVVQKVLKRFEKEEKVFYENSFIIIINFIKHQTLNPKIKKGIEDKLKLLPQIVKASIGYNKLLKALNYLNFNLTLIKPKLKSKLNIKTKEKKPADESAKNELSISKTNIKKQKFGEFSHVLLSEEQYKILDEEWGHLELGRMIDVLDQGIEMKGYKYKNHLLALRTWKKKEKTDKQTKPKGRQINESTYDTNIEMGF